MYCLRNSSGAPPTDATKYEGCQNAVFDRLLRRNSCHLHKLFVNDLVCLPTILTRFLAPIHPTVYIADKLI